jgi:sec-independent protein translocase protein TatA
MGNVGLGEIAVIVLVVLLVFGPNKLPEIMRNLGKAYRVFQEETQKAAKTLRDSIEEPPAQAPPGPGIIDTPDDTPDEQPAQANPEDPKRTLEDT